MKKFIALVAIALISGSAVAADAKKIVVAKAAVKASAKRVVTAPAQNPLDDSRFDDNRLASFSCCSLPQ